VASAHSDISPLDALRIARRQAGLSGLTSLPDGRHQLNRRATIIVGAAAPARIRPRYRTVEDLTERHLFGRIGLASSSLMAPSDSYRDVKGGQLRPALFDHRGFPLLAGRQHLLSGATHLRLQEFATEPHLQAQLPAELMTAKNATRLDVVLSNHEQLAQVHR
jgi:hypothetical protein